MQREGKLISARLTNSNRGDARPRAALTRVVALAALLAGGVLACPQSPDQDEVEKELPVATVTGGAKAVAPVTAKPTASPTTATPAAAPVDVDEKGVPLIPKGRSKPPTMAEWDAGLEVNTQGPHSRPPDCHLKVVREWLKVHCDGKITKITDMTNFGSQGHDYFEHVELGKVADFIVRLKPGMPQKIRIWREPTDRATLFVNWPTNRDRPVHIALGICLPTQPCWNQP